MLKLIRGILEYRRTKRPAYQAVFAELAQQQKPDALLIACSDSRVMPNLFASTEPGDLFVARNVGNLVPPHPALGTSESATLEYAAVTLEVRNIIICGHSQCGGMKALMEWPVGGSGPLQQWLRHGEAALRRFQGGFRMEGCLSPANQLSQINVLQQMDHVLSYPAVTARVGKHELSVHGWWFDIAHAEVFHYDPGQEGFVVIDEAELERLAAEKV